MTVLPACEFHSEMDSILNPILSEFEEGGIELGIAMIKKKIMIAFMIFLLSSIIVSV